MIIEEEVRFRSTQSQDILCFMLDLNERLQDLESLAHPFGDSIFPNSYILEQSAIYPDGRVVDSSALKTTVFAAYSYVRTSQLEQDELQKASLIYVTRK